MDKKEKSKSSMLVVLLLGIGGTVLFFNFIQNFFVSRESRLAIIEEDKKVYTEIAKAYSLGIQNSLQGYMQALNYYVDSDVMKDGSFSQMRSWLIDHESSRPGYFDYIMLAGEDGSAYTDIGTSTDISSREYFDAIFKQGKGSYIDDPVISKTNGKAVIHITRAIKRNGKNIALLCGVMDLSSLTKEASDLKIGKEGYTWMIASNGLIISHPNQDYIMTKNFITDLPKGNEDMASLAKDLCSGNSGVRWVKGRIKGKDLIVYQTIPGTTWGLAISVPEHQINELATRIRMMNVGFGALIVIMTIVSAGLIVFKTIKPLQIVKDTITGIATGNADLTQRIEIKNNNEIGQVVVGFNKFTEKLQNIITDVKSSKEELSIAGEDMSATSQDTSAAITQIIANIDSIHRQIENQGSSVHETAGAVNEIASNIASLESMIESQSAGVSQASAAVEQMIGNISSVNQSVDKMAVSFTDLKSDAQLGFNKQQDVNERIKQIENQSEMLQEANAAISAIAEQTNLLAMNAAIEAAHAGEAGKGFSVVADEIRKLSETSTSQSKTIGDQLNNIKDSIKEVVGASVESSQAFESVSKKLEQTDELVMQIKAAMEEQNSGSRQINEALHNMNDSTIQVKNAAQEMTEGNKAILEEVRLLQDATGSMKDSMTEMSAGARKINDTGVALETISEKVRDSIQKIGNQIDLFKV